MIGFLDFIGYLDLIEYFDLIGYLGLIGYINIIGFIDLMYNISFQGNVEEEKKEEEKLTVMDISGSILLMIWIRKTAGRQGARFGQNRAQKVWFYLPPTFSQLIISPALFSKL